MTSPIDPNELTIGNEDPNGPLIYVIGQLDFPGMSELARELGTAQARGSFDGIRQAGGRPRLVASSALDRPAPGTILSEADGLVFLGGSDVDVTLYDQSGVEPNHYGGADKRADEYCIELLQQAAAQNIPTLAFCKGSQLMNVAFGGTLIGDIGEWQMHRGAHLPELMIDERLTLDEDSLIAAILGRTEVTVRNGHHQAVDRVGDALRAVANADDGIVEGVEHRTASFMVGVQWHPDDAGADLTDRARIFDALISRAKA
ncbi:gamma-glutamyl-gamma-aminobutyrate hydrolase family protein [Leucobacter sp. UT-8R-CII-1-4]|uniref:gamma-glutamyl-gamma-aminobutyrate hydrolase family protein n=1 Tax=Leucobacter sp. UT-8R-CII-1-4 TaxID=3040075 RepID=UPI0024A88A88|nr:gamma-glutamyl-gamma-aminobutyrate hydrolase family protein [Leucobacter sp. UT-8R-CII-1-4]MDI6022195.1 gamma-glutamyl-gamma-aminobutyrate hydrolase family protein [Leucobacter sp. UT-8R-CII-1-4]